VRGEWWQLELINCGADNIALPNTYTLPQAEGRSGYNRRKTMKNVKLVYKLGLGFGLILVLTLAVAFTGYWGLNRVEQHADLVNDTNHMITSMLEARRQEKNFTLRGFTVISGDTQNSVEKMQAILDQAEAQLAQTASELDEAEEQELLAVVGNDLNHYKEAFNTYVQLQRQKDEAVFQMVKEANNALELVDAMLADQQAKLAAELKANAGSTVLQERLSKVDDAARLQSLMLATRQSEKNFMLQYNQADVQEVTKTVETMRLLLQDMQMRFKDAANDTQADKVMANLAAYETAFKNYVEAVNRQLEQESGMVAAARTVGVGLKQFETIQTQQMYQAENSAVTLAFVMAGLALIVGLGTAVVSTRAITGPLRQLQAVSQQIAGGNVAVAIDIDQRDEVGQLANAFRQMVAYLQTMTAAAEQLAQGDLSIAVTPQSAQDALGNAFAQMIGNLRRLIEQVSASVGKVNAAAVQLNTASEQSDQATRQIVDSVLHMAKGSSQQTDSITRAAAMVSQVSQAIDGVARGAQEQAAAVTRTAELMNRISGAIDQVADNARAGAAGSAEAAAAARQGAATVDANLKGMEVIKTKVGLLDARVKQMGQSSAQIGMIVETIDDIAGQTNLLALNAAIEAARAGEHGKGFAVVADEVRKLAEKAAVATKEIGALINTIRQTAAKAVTAMEEGSLEVDNGVERANSAGQALNNILQAVETVNRQVNDISASAGQINNASDELLQAMETVSAVVEESTASAEEMAAGSGEVNDAISSIASVSQENSAIAEEVSASTEQMSAQVQEVTASAQMLNHMADELTSVVSLFKLDSAENIFA
jgi:methyl-accepting chemotaxis protein